MNAVFKKMNYKDQPVLYIINPPQSFTPALIEMGEFATVKTTLAKANTVSFFLAFVTERSEIDNMSRAVAPLLEPMGILWFAYPKASSKKYKCEFNRDNGWSTLGELGFEGVRMVAIDEDWSALRFKRAKEIKSMTRTFAMSEGRKKAAATILTKKKA
jgi:hypothetical protein